MLRRARRAGVTAFDLTGARDVGLAEVLVQQAFPEGDPEIVLLTEDSLRGAPPFGGVFPRVVPPSVGDARGGRSRDGPAPASPFRRLLVREGPTASFRRPLRPTGGVERGVSEAGSTEPVAILCHTTEDVRTAVESGSALPLAGALSLLEPGLFAEFLDRGSGERGCTWIAQDPFAGGRLDAGRLGRPSPPPPGRAGPATVYELTRAFEPVLRFGFLAKRGERTLLQAALQFVLGYEPVVAACVPLPSPERFEEILRFRTAPPLSPEELAAIHAAGQGAIPGPDPRRRDGAP